MSDDSGRDEGSRHQRETEEFGGPLFGDSSNQGSGGGRRPSTSEDDTDSLNFGPTDTGPLPHWTDPPTGEVPRIQPTEDPSGGLEEDVDVWSSFTSESPVWREDIAESDPTGPVALPDPSGELPAPAPPPADRPRDPSGGHRRAEVPTEQHDIHVGDQPDAGPGPSTGPIPVGRREPARIQIGTDPSGVQRRDPPGAGRSRGAPGTARRSSTTQRPRRAPSKGRDMPAAIVAAVVIAGVFVAASMWRPVGVLAIIVAILAVASYEYFSNVAARGYRPAVAAGVLACIGAPLATYWMSEFALPLVIALAFIAGAVSFIGADSVESGPLPNMAITTMGVIWIGVLGSYAVSILNYSTLPGSPSWGTDTLVLVALGVAANDIGALFIGSSAGKTPLRSWISPAKSLEGLIGGTVVTIVAFIVVGIAGLSDTWESTGELVVFAIVVSVMAPLGDLTESMFKRNLDVKDFGTLVAGHGGVLDRFDGFLFTLPAVYYLTVWIQPWA